MQIDQDTLGFVLTGAAALVVMAPGLFVFIRSVRTNERVATRLGARARAANPAAAKTPGATKADEPPKWLKYFSGGPIADLTNISAVKFQLMKAGYLNKSAVSWYYFARFFAIVFPQLVLLAALPFTKSWPENGALIASVLLAGLGLIAPERFVESRIQKRKLEYTEGFPDMMDLMVACIEAGLSLDASVQRVSDEIVNRYPNLAMHLQIIALELRAGRSRQDAWKNFADRLDLEEATSLVTMLRQSEEMGSSLGQTLRIFSSDMRRRRILAAEEKALALPAKMTVPLIVFVFPVLLGVLVLPAGVKLSQAFESMG